MLGLLQEDPAHWFEAGTPDSASELDAAGIEALLRERERLRAEKDFAAADRLRDQLREQGIVIEDGAGGTGWRRGSL